MKVFDFTAKPAVLLVNLALSPFTFTELPGRLSGLRIFELKPKVNSSTQM